MKSLSRSVKLSFAIAVALASLSFSAKADIVFDYSATTVNQSGPWILGNDFQVNSPITVDAVGVFAGAYSSSTSLPVGIYENTSGGPGGTWQLVSGTLQSVPSSGATIGGAKWVQLPSNVTLGLGHYAIVAIVDQDGNNNVSPTTIGFNTLGGALTLENEAIWNNSPGSLGATLTGLNHGSYPLPTFAAGTFSTVPEPSTYAAGLFVLIVFGVHARKSLRRFCC